MGSLNIASKRIEEPKLVAVFKAKVVKHFPFVFNANEKTNHMNMLMTAYAAYPHRKV